MPERPVRNYPPVGSDDRFDQIVRRGRSLRRRRQLGVGAGAGGALAAVALAVVLVTGGSDSPDQPLVADAPDTDDTTTTTTTTAPPTDPDEMTVTVVEVDGSTRIVVEDPEQPQGELAQQCVLVTLHDSDEAEGGPAVAEGYTCDDLPPGEAGVPLPVFLTGGVEIGCASSMTNEPPAADRPTAAVTTTFAVDVGAVPAGEYRMEVSATSGIGDGCAGTGDEVPGGTERSATTSAAVDIS